MNAVKIQLEGLLIDFENPVVRAGTGSSIQFDILLFDTVGCMLCALNKINPSITH